MDSPYALFVPAYCLVSDGSRLTVMSQTSAVKAAEVYLAGGVNKIILSTAYNVWAKEAEFKKQILLDAGVPVEAVEVIPAITDSFDEVEKVREIVKRFNIDELIVVADYWQGPRAVLIFKHKFPWLKINYRAFKTPKYEYALEPHPIKLLGVIKGWRIGHELTWAIWNIMMYLITLPLLYLNHSRKTTHRPKTPSR